jgi:DNA-binding protein H-NS
MMEIKMSGLKSVEELNVKIAELEKARNDLIQQERANVIAEVKAKIREYNLTAADLGFRKGGGTKKKDAKSITFRDGDLTWDGDIHARGRKPTWIAERIANGTIEKYRVA